MSHFLTIVASNSSYLYDDLDRYCEQTENEDYLEFEDKTEELKEEYEGTVTGIRFPNGLVVEDCDSRFTALYKVKDNKVYRKWFGKNKIDKITKKCKKHKVLDKYPAKKIYKTFDEFATNGRYEIYHEEQEAYGYYYNPQGFYDWFAIGGRWAEQVLVKKDVEDVVEDEPALSIDKKRKAPKGYKWVSGAKKSDIEWEKMRRMKVKQAVRLYYKHQKIYEYIYKNILENKHNLYKIDDDCLYYWDEIVYKHGESLKDYLRRQGLLDRKYFINCYAFVNTSNEWNSKGQMGWFCISMDEKASLEWHNEIETFIKELDDDKYIIFVDCHI